MAKAYRYRGILGKQRTIKMPLGSWFNPDSPEWQAKADAAIQAQEEALIDALFTDCGVRRSDPFGWQDVALTLARRHVMAFQPTSARRRGRPPTEDWDLAAEVMQVVRSRNMSIRSASRIVAKRRGEEKSSPTVESRFHTTMKAGKKAKEQLKTLLQEMRQK